MARVLVCILHKPTLHPKLLEYCQAMVAKLPAANPEHQIDTIFDARPVEKIPGDLDTPWKKVYIARNNLLAKIDLDKYDYLFWPDSDIISYPADIITRSIAQNPGGITAPMCLIEGGSVFYDYCGYIIKGGGKIESSSKSPRPDRNIMPAPPYWKIVPKESLVEMDGVGAINLVPTDIYKTGTKYCNDMTRTDHWSVMEKCREMGRKVMVDRTMIAYHACLPNYGLEWN